MANNDDDGRKYTGEDFEWMTAYSKDLLKIIAHIMEGGGEMSSDMTYFMHLIQVGHAYELGELD